MTIRTVGGEGSADAVLELRQYTLRPGTRDTLIELFDREFVETQEAVGMRVVGQFRDLDAADRFVWLRGFADMAARKAALTAFYGGPVWAAHRDAARATMVDTDDVLLLRPVGPGTGFPPAPPRPGAGAGAMAAGLYVAEIHHLDEPAEAGFLELFEASVEPALRAAGSSPVATLVTESSRNTFTRLPVREGESVLVRVARFADAAAYDRHRAALAASPAWRAAAEALEGRLRRPVEVLRLAPTDRSALR